MNGVYNDHREFNARGINHHTNSSMENFSGVFDEKGDFIDLQMRRSFMPALSGRNLPLISTNLDSNRHLPQVDSSYEASMN